MKNIIAAFLILSFGSQVLAQDIKGEKMTLAFHQVIISKSVLDSAFFGSKLYDSYRIQGEEGKDMTRAVRQAATDIAYDVLTEEILETLDIELFPMEKLKETANYSEYGYPNAAVIKLVARKDDSPYYLKLSTNTVYKPDSYRKESGKLDLSSKNVKAYVSTELIVFDSTGKKIRTLKGEAYSEENIKTYKSIDLYTDDYGSLNMDLDNFQTLLRKACANLISSF